MQASEKQLYDQLSHVEQQSMPIIKSGQGAAVYPQTAWMYDKQRKNLVDWSAQNFVDEVLVSVFFSIKKKSNFLFYFYFFIIKVDKELKSGENAGTTHKIVLRFFTDFGLVNYGAKFDIYGNCIFSLYFVVK